MPSDDHHKQTPKSPTEKRHPDTVLPAELRHGKIVEVRNPSGGRREAYQIVFDQHWLPYSYWNPPPDGWEMFHARTEYRNQSDGLLGQLYPDKACICICVKREVNDRD